MIFFFRFKFLTITTNVRASGVFQVFRPQNPWTMAIMNVLAELHQEHDLKVKDFFLYIYANHRNANP